MMDEFGSCLIEFEEDPNNSGYYTNKAKELWLKIGEHVTSTGLELEVIDPVNNAWGTVYDVPVSEIGTEFSSARYQWSKTGIARALAEIEKGR